MSRQGRAYVLSQSDVAGGHHCHWPGCKAAVAPARWGCRPHWFRLPKSLREQIWETFRPGQQISKTPSADYLAVADAVQQWIWRNAAAEVGRPMIKTLSMKQPWAWLVAHGHKPIENRSWSTAFRGDFQIHASKAWGREQRWDEERVRELAPEIVLPEKYELGGIIGRGRIIDVVKSHPSCWFFGPFGFMVADAVPQAFHAYPGQLGWFDAPDMARRDA